MRKSDGLRTVLAFTLVASCLACSDAPPDPAEPSSEEIATEEEIAAEETGDSEPPAPPEFRGALRELSLAGQAEKDGDLEAALEHGEKALAGAPQHPLFIRTQARILALVGQDQPALDLLQRLVEVGATTELNPEDWESLAGSERFQAIAAGLEENRRHRPQGEIVYRLEDPKLYPEGITWDPVENAFYLGSTAKSKIVRISAGGEVEDFIGENEHGLLNPLGMAVDPERRGLWVASTAYPPHGGASEEDLGRSAVFHFGLDGSLRHHLPLDERPRRHFLNDLDVAADGEVFVTDSETASLYRVSPEKLELELFVTLPDANFPNGIALSDDDRHLYVAHLEGMSRVDRQTRQVIRVEEPPGVAIGHGDGIAFHRNSLLVVQNQASFGFRVARFTLDPSGERAGRVEVLHAGLVDGRLPYTGVVAGDRFYFNMSANLDEGDEAEPLILAVGL